MNKRLYRSRTNRIIWGVCGGVAEYFNVDPAIVRVIFVLLVFAGGLGIIAYIVLAIIAPLEGSEAKPPREMVKENIQEIKETTTQLSKEVQESLSKKDRESASDEHHRTVSWLGAVLIIIGVLFLFGNLLGRFGWFQWNFIWPVILIIIGLLIIASRRK
jgi:phage shock protein C